MTRAPDRPLSIEDVRSLLSHILVTFEEQGCGKGVVAARIRKTRRELDGLSLGSTPLRKITSIPVDIGGVLGIVTVGERGCKPMLDPKNTLASLDSEMGRMGRLPRYPTDEERKSAISGAHFGWHVPEAALAKKLALEP